VACSTVAHRDGGKRPESGRGLVGLVFVSVMVANSLNDFILYIQRLPQPLPQLELLLAL
jgi:hypothetical protein